jgi:hypothetical protein
MGLGVGYGAPGLGIIQCLGVGFIPGHGSCFPLSLKKKSEGWWVD